MNDYSKEILPVETKSNLLKGWKWVVYDDESGSLQSPTGKNYFSFDWTSREYQVNSSDDYSCFGYTDDDGNRLTFVDFKKYAEEYIIKKILQIKENIIMKKTEQEDLEIMEY